MADSESIASGGSRLFTGHWGELAVALILSATAVSAAWSGFQAAKWGGAMTVAFNEAAVSRTVAASDIAQASRDITGDRATFGSFVLALGAGDETTAAILFTEFRDEVQPLIESWLAKDPFTDLSVGSPFDDDAYTVFETVAIASEALEDAETYTTVALDARSNAGNYTLATVMFAIVLFLAGLSRQFAIRAVTIGLAAVASVLLAAGITALILLPTLI
jgi:hypothetical protein